MNTDSQAYIEKRMSVYAACYCYGANYHTGQNSNAYRLLCTAGRHFSPGLTFGINEYATREDFDAADLLDRLIARNY
jgi:hypothetical protein